MDPELCSPCTPCTSTSDVLPPSRLSFEAFVFFFDRMVILRNRSPTSSLDATPRFPENDSPRWEHAQQGSALAAPWTPVPSSPTMRCPLIYYYSSSGQPQKPRRARRTPDDAPDAPRRRSTLRARNQDDVTLRANHDMIPLIINYYINSCYFECFVRQPWLHLHTLPANWSVTSRRHMSLDCDREMSPRAGFPLVTSGPRPICFCIFFMSLK